ncbi:MAG: U32 family peptidase, partial [Acholeplasmatales bacterium]|nr:U32 family peptidase [Acholeplasmatales bacterium]
MHFATSIYTLEQLNNLKDKIEYAILMQDKTSLNYKDLDLDKALEFCKNNNIKTIIGMDKLFTPTNIDLVSIFFDKYQNLCDYFYITDLGVCNIAIKKKIENKVIFDPKTMVCNSLDLKIYSDLGFRAIGLSSEITIKDLMDIYSKTKANIFYQVFGYRLMFYSKRHLISLYEKKNN